MKLMSLLLTAGLLAVAPVASYADPDDRQDRRQERGRADERQDRRDCRREEGVAGQDKRECKQEEVRDGVHGRRDDGDDGES